MSRLAIECGMNPRVPCRSASLRSDRVTVGVDQHFAPPDVVGLADESILLHPLNQPRRAVVADAELALQVGYRRLLTLGDDLNGLAVELGLGVVLARRLPVEQIAAILGLLGHRLDIFGCALPPPMLGDRAHLLVADEWTMDADDLLTAGHVEHVALAQQLLGALLAED